MIGTSEVPSPTPGVRLAGWLMAVQVVVIVGFVVYYLVELAAGHGDDRLRVVMSCVVFLIMAVVLGVLARGLLRNFGWSTTPTVLWNALLLPVGISLIQASQVAVGIGVLGLAAASIIAVLAGRGGDRGSGAGA